MQESQWLAVRDRDVQDAARSIQHMQKALTSMNVQLANAISDIGGLSGQTILRQKPVAECDDKLKSYLAVLPSRPAPPADIEGKR